ncbi:hypothetical protein MMAG44476_01110 [Mycolicibacterium mageritense DSM 44476 = CIP 104973]|uniref:Uncharacterized protein n=1 Tax=Mycolicibacterium mageritense TaxID=53462 RepID=A0AAI8TX02_MYCME|nr:hypothetical protein [Mycolicibacterium mageritense]MCC9182839.1 hypothetical protein [Mycolicibacterium mageritense]BBX35427.1 hypothetical protein MMAGJ_47090 [Mycolicibacterium mageritense]BDY30323.1 hypothetical protein hbim_04266 [Mycolicibacterium mageritense]CDO20065.1 hypothetical protein BN978_00517 [Mycolicibacterium mageritense DSM 44476 = CIP 104973]
MTETHTEKRGDEQSSRKLRLSVNWVLAILTIPAAIAVFLFGMGKVMGMAGCTGPQCASEGPGDFWFGILFYGAPVVPVITLAVSIFTARLRRGIVVPLIALALLAVDFAVLALTFHQ